jgi:hypothetical protein
MEGQQDQEDLLSTIVFLRSVQNVDTLEDRYVFACGMDNA